jgi:hypothetical protein
MSGGFSNTVDIGGLQQLRDCVDASVLDFLKKNRAKLRYTTRRRLVEKLVNELGYFVATEDLRHKVKLSKRGQKPRIDLQAFLSQLEKHFNSAGIKLVEWKWGDKERRDANNLAGKLLACIGEDPPSPRQWRQRHYFL